ncbi:hypothetical protein F2Q65_09865 [Thiohalocapsa marina]|uniref:Uncharacterized protein n=1 Tax=Thiohalocapsa marina TaxID=424902 RepID=A0A5M8FL41_9GAMM|nr:DUF6776 family protein [Thiohalocapsa marina]KAA6185204.1 hypothetical protein F2Q65_09865 [Thiohalocapsa marina]
MSFRLLVTAGWLLVIGTAFALGYLLAGHDAQRAMARIQALQTERDTLSEALAEMRDAQVRLERTHMIDQEARRAVQAQLVELQGERLRLARQVAYLGSLIREGDRGAVEIRAFALTAMDAPGAYRYRIILSQLVPEFGRSVGEASVHVVLERDSQLQTLALSDLPGSSLGRHELAFDHFQRLEGVIQLPADATPRQVVVDIEPGSDNLLATSESFVWRTGDAAVDLLRADEADIPSDDP